MGSPYEGKGSFKIFLFVGQNVKLVLTKSFVKVLNNTTWSPYFEKKKRKKEKKNKHEEHKGAMLRTGISWWTKKKRSLEEDDINYGTAFGRF